MYQQNHSSGAKWLFWLAVIFIAITFMLGFNLKDAKWLNGDIAAAEAGQINLANTTDQQNAELDYLNRKVDIERKNQQADQQAKIDAAKQDQELEAQKIANSQLAAFREKIYSTLDFGLSLLMIVVSIVVVILGVFGAFGMRRWMAAKARMPQVSQPPVANYQKPLHQPSPEAIQARVRERKQRQAMVAMKYTVRTWPENGADQEPIPGKPWAN